MNRREEIYLLRPMWAEYLRAKGHKVKGDAEQISVLHSRNGRTSYRWILEVSEAPTLKFGRAEQGWLRQQLKCARRTREKAYLVVGFLVAPPRIVVVPVVAALKARHVRCDRGGIAWDI